MPKEQWPITEALVFSVDWTEPSRNDSSHYTVIYSYRVGEELYTGQFRDYTGEQDSYLHQDDVISVRYCPELPAPKQRMVTTALVSVCSSSA
jgi:hypothetical protein